MDIYFPIFIDTIFFQQFSCFFTMLPKHGKDKLFSFFILFFHLTDCTYKYLYLTICFFPIQL